MNFINISMQRQLNVNWCWAAITSAIRMYYAPYSPSPTSQIDIVRDIYPQMDNKPYPIEYSLAGNYSNQSTLNLNFNDVFFEINNTHPICCMTIINPAQYHYFLISGCDNASQNVIVLDPNSLDDSIKPKLIAFSLLSPLIFTAYFTNPM
ncbi:C39 family peptidase [Enterobacter quasiroggenkampii]